MLSFIILTDIVSEQSKNLPSCNEEGVEGSGNIAQNATVDDVNELIPLNGLTN